MARFADILHRATEKDVKMHQAHAAPRAINQPLPEVISRLERRSCWQTRDRHFVGRIDTIHEPPCALNICNSCHAFALTPAALLS